MELKYPLIIDGATGTQLQKRGFKGDICAEQWILEHPEAIVEIQRQYVESGSQIVYAPTFGANRVKLAEYGLGDKVEEFNKRLVALSREAVGESVLIAGDIAPTGHFLEPMGDMSFEEFVEVYTQQAKVLEEAGVDLYVIETSMTLPEVRAAILAIKSVSKKPIFVTFSVDEFGKCLGGTDAVTALIVTQAMGIDAFGLNCFSDLEKLPALLKQLQEVAEIPLIAKPNAGLPVIQEGKTVYLCTPEMFASYVNSFAESGVMVFGGCCGTTEEHIQGLSNAIKQVELRIPECQKKDFLLAATEKMHAVLPSDVQCEEFYACDEDLEDAIYDAEDLDDLIIGIRVEDEESLEYFAECQFALTKPVCFACENADLLEKALRLYQGRALYEGGLSEKELQPLVEKYGLII